MPESPVVPSQPPHDSTSPRTRSKKRAWLFRGGIVAAGWCCVELASWGMLQLLATGGVRQVIEEREAFRQMVFHLDAIDQAAEQTQTIHPFVGWVRNPDVLKSATYEGTRLTTNRLGFLDTSEGIFTRDPRRLIVAITGGSVAYQMSCAGAERLKERLRAIPEYRDREIILIRLAQEAFKQPQALFSLNYYMLQGGEFDIVVNLDGLNELTMSLSQNYPLHVALDYPQGWKMRTAEIIPARESDVAMELVEIRGQRRSAAIASTRSIFARFPSQVLLWSLRDRRLRDRLIELQSRAAQDDFEPSFIRCGPPPLARTEAEALTECVRIWKQSSLQIHRLCQASGILYVHAIQPNQYDPGSKLLAPSELDLMRPDSPGNRDQAFVPIVAEGFPRLRAASAELRAAGVPMLDLTGLFAKISDPLYVDSCCHVNPTGSELLAGAIGDFIQDLKQHE
jgi:hypothetical protein